MSHLKTTKIYDDVIVDPLEGDLRNRARELSLFFRHDIDILGANDHIHRLIFLKAAVHAGKFLSIHAYHTVGMHDAVNDVGLPDEIGHECVLGLIVDIGGRANLLDVPLVHDHDGVGHGQGLLLIVGHIDEGDAHLLLDPL